MYNEMVSYGEVYSMEMYDGKGKSMRYFMFLMF